MGSEVIIIPIIFGVILAIAYLYFSTRNKVAYPGTIFLLAGVGLMVGFNMTKKLEKED